MGFFEGLVSAAGDILGGVTSNIINQNQQENEATRNQSNFNIQMDETIQRRVKDAGKAGLHPLYALGANSMPSSQPIVMNDSIGPSMRDAGQSLSTAIARQSTIQEREKEVLTNNLLRSNIAESDARAELARSEAQRISQSGQNGIGIQKQNFNTPDGQAPNPPGQTFGPVQDVVDVKGSPVVSGSSKASGFVSGTNDYYQQWRLRDGFYLPLPRSEDEGPEETIQNMSLGAWKGMLEQGQAMYGGNWAQEMSDWRYRGIPPKGHYLSVEEQGPRRRSTWKESHEKGFLRNQLEEKLSGMKKGIDKFIKEGGEYEQDWLQKQYQKWRR